MVWSGDEVSKFVKIRDRSQIQPSGIDLTADIIYEFQSAGILSDRIHELPVVEAQTDSGDYWFLSPGAYLVRYKEIIEIPKNAIGLVLPRSSLLRIGCTIQTAVWEPGYKGRGVGLLIVSNPKGVIIRRGSRIAQLIFISSRARRVYRGQWQGEGLKKQELKGESSSN